MGDREVLRYKDIVLRPLDVDVLKGPCYLNDKVIGFYFCYLSSLCNRKDVLFLPPWVCFWLAKSDPQTRKEAEESFQFQTKRLVVFVVNDNVDLSGKDDGAHWSTLVYDRSQHAFLHLDTMEGQNHDAAFELYESVKDFFGKATTSTLKSTSLKGKNKKKEGPKQAAATISKPAITTEAVFKECDSPQQTNEYDCGVYVLAIAKTICECYSILKIGKDADWHRAVKRDVNSSVEITFRNEVMQLIEDLKNN